MFPLFSIGQSCRVYCLYTRLFLLYMLSPYKASKLQLTTTLERCYVLCWYVYNLILSVFYVSNKYKHFRHVKQLFQVSHLCRFDKVSLVAQNTSHQWREITKSNILTWITFQCIDITNEPGLTEQCYSGFSYFTRVYERYKRRLHRSYNCNAGCQ